MTEVSGWLSNTAPPLSCVRWGLPRPSSVRWGGGFLLSFTLLTRFHALRQPPGVQTLQKWVASGGRVSPGPPPWSERWRQGPRAQREWSSMNSCIWGPGWEGPPRHPRHKEETVWDGNRHGAASHCAGHTADASAAGGLSRRLVSLGSPLCIRLSFPAWSCLPVIKAICICYVPGLFYFPGGKFRKHICAVRFNKSVRE